MFATANEKNIERIIQMYYSCINKEKLYLAEYNKMEEMKKLDENKIKSISFDSGGGNGCSVRSFNTHMDRLLEKQMDMKIKADKHKRVHICIDKEFDLTNNIKKLSTESQIVIYHYYNRGLSIEQIASEEDKTIRTIKRRLERSIEELAVLIYGE